MRVLLLLALAMHLLAAPAWAQAPAVVPVTLPVPAAPIHLREAAGTGDVVSRSLLLHDAGGDFPASAADIGRWSAGQRAATAIKPGGGSYWLLVSVANDSALANWVLQPTNALIMRVETRLYDAAGGAAGPPMLTGFEAPHDYMLHYGNDMRLEPGRRSLLLLRFSTRFSVRQPVFSLIPQEQMRRLVLRESVLAIGALGALTALALYNFFLFSVTRRTAYLYYSLFVSSYALAWALPFNVFADLFGWHMVRTHYVPFFLLPVFSTLFYRRFLELDTRAPMLAKISRINIVLPLLLLPSCFLDAPVAPRLTTLVMAIYMPLALCSGVVAWRRGFRPARYFVMGFIALLAPAVPILLSNSGVLPPMDINLPNLLLVGGTIDALLLAFALADQIRLLGDRMESQVAARTADLVRANTALTAAKEHAEVVSRHRIDFLSAMSHDIRTPLAGIIGMLKLALRDSAVRGRTADYLRIGLSNGDALLVILNDILDYSKIDAGKLTIETTSFHLGRLVGDAVGILQEQAEARGLSLRAVCAEGLPEHIVGDPTRIRQILVNLLGNAIKFTDHGEVLLSVRALTGADGAAHLQLSVQDTGPGISAQMQARLFQKFEQGDHSTTRKYGGTGLGLAICKELVALMGGSIAVASTAGKGSRFDVTLPLQAADGAAADDAAAASAPPHQRRLRILCAEDVLTNQIIIKALLEAMGHSVVLVEDGVATLAALDAGEFDMVLMDGRMPRMDGAQATLHIRAGGAGARNARIPIIALTANASQADCEHYLAAGMDGFLPKPVDELALHRVIAAVIDAVDAVDAIDLAPVPAATAATAATTGMAPLPGLSAQQMQRIAAAFVAEAPRRMAQARAALADGRRDDAGEAFHALKGSAAYLRSPLVATLAAQLEARAASDRLGSDDPAVQALEQALDNAVATVAATVVASTATVPGAPAVQAIQ